MHLNLVFALLSTSVLGSRAMLTVPGEDFTWTLANTDGSILVPATVPGGVYTDLMNGGVLDKGDFYYRYNDLEYRWVGNEYWFYETYIEATPALLSYERIVLEFDGLDTYASVFIEDRFLQISNQNMFTRNLMDVKHQLTPSTNIKLTVQFRPPVGYANDSFHDYEAGYRYQVLPECVSDAYKGECHVNMIRKMQASFSWDWGPAFPSVGIWRPWRIVGWSSLKISNVYFASVPLSALPAVPDPNLKVPWRVTYKVYFDLAVASGTINGSLVIKLDEVDYVSEALTLDAASYEGMTGSYEGTFDVPADTFETWWPNGYGDQTLYNFTVTFTSTSLPSSDFSTVKKSVGFRTVELDESLVDSNNQTLGRHYRARVNNVFMFLKGSNWIPAHVLPEQVAPEYTRQLLQDARDTNQNCIRIWGGGIYESDEFYNYCDELGLLIWEDMMFACSMYPADNLYLKKVEEETLHQVQRLQHHPSLLLWATNNENEAALSDNWYGTDVDFDQYKGDYIKLYVDTISVTLRTADTSRPTVISSPSNGIESEESGYIAQNPSDNRYGDVHYYNYLKNGWQWENYPPTRFASEYGFQSFPSYETFAPVLAPEDMAADSLMMEHRQHHPSGQAELTNQLQMHFDYNISYTSFEDYLYLVQLHQAVADKTETEFYRRMRSTLNEDGSGLTMGALYWQLNDVWQGASWASIEHGGRWKIVHNYAKDFFSPIIVVPWIVGQELIVSVVSDLAEDYPLGSPGELRVAISLVRYYVDLAGSSEKIITMFIQRASITGQWAEEVLRMDLENDLAVTNFCSSSEAGVGPYDNCFILVEIFDQQGDALAPRNFLLLGEPKDAYLPPVAFSVAISEPSEDTFSLDILADRLAMFVYLESPFKGVFSSNGFILTWNEATSVTFKAREPVTLDEFRQTLKIRAVINSYDTP